MYFVGPIEARCVRSALCQHAAGSVEAGGDPADAMNVLLRESVDVLRAPVSGWVAEVSDLDAIEFAFDYTSTKANPMKPKIPIHGYFSNASDIKKLVDALIHENTKYYEDRYF